MLLQQRAAALALQRGAAAQVGLLPARRFRDPAPYPQREESGQDAEQKHVAPSIGPQCADVKPHQRRDEEPDPQAALHQPGALAARLVRPELGRDRRTGSPLGADGNADEKPKRSERHPVPREGAQPGHERVRQDRDHHGPLASDVIGQNAADHAPDSPAEQREGDDGAGVARDLRELRRREQLMQSYADRQQKGVGLVAVEHPAEIRGDERIPLPPIKAAVPRLRSSYADLGHRGPLPKADACIIAADVTRMQPARVFDARLDAVAPYAEQPRGSLQVGLKQAIARLEAAHAVLFAQKTQQADDVTVIVQIVEVDVAVGLDAVAQHVLVVAPHEHVGQSLLDILARDDAVIAGFFEQLHPVFEAILVDRRAVFRHQIGKRGAVHLTAPSGSTFISSAQYDQKPRIGVSVTRWARSCTAPRPPISMTAQPSRALRVALCTTSMASPSSMLTKPAGPTRLTEISRWRVIASSSSA